MVSPEKHPLLDDGDLRRNRIMSNLKDSVLSRLNPDDDHFQIHHQLQNLFPSFDTPTHPPYALMIRRAITELNNHRIGSTEEAISEFVQRDYQDLPWAHLKILNLHLRKLCQSGEVVYTKAGRYILKEEEEEEQQHTCKGSVRKKRMKRRMVIPEESVEINENGTGGGDRVLEVESTQEKGEQQCVEEKLTQNEPRESPIQKDQDQDQDEVPQHYNQGQGNLVENPMSGTGCLELEKKLPKRPRGRPRKSDVANYQEESLFHIIHDDQELFTNNSKLQLGGGQSRRKGRGRHPKVNQDTEQCGRAPCGRGRGRGQGRPPKLNFDTDRLSE